MTMTATATEAPRALGPFKVLVLDRVDPAGIALLGAVAEVDARDSVAPDELLRIIGDYDALMVRSATKATAAVIEAGKRLKVIGRAGVGVDNIDVPAATARGVIVLNSPDGNTVAAAEHATALMLALARHLSAADAAMKQGEWKRERFTGIELYQKTLGVVGLGKIGSRVAKAALALGMRVIVTDPFLAPERAQELQVEPVSFDTLLAQSDFISMHVPKTPETTGLFGASTLARCKRGVRLINCARGGILDEAALAEAILSGQVAGAALDVFATEPLPESPLRALGDAVILTPHLGASTEEAQVKVAVDVAEQIAMVLKGESARSAVNIPAMRPEILEPVRPFLGIAEQLGSFIAQWLEGRVEQVEIVYQGGLAAKNVAPLTVTLLKGMLAQVAEGVNAVNALMVAKQRGIEVKESKSSEAADYADLLTVTVRGGGQVHTVAGTLLGNHEPRLVRIDAHAFNLSPAGGILMVPHEDRPGVIGQVGTLLGQNGINIFGFQLGRQSKGGPALMVLNVDEAVGSAAIAQIEAIDGYAGVHYVRL